MFPVLISRLPPRGVKALLVNCRNEKIATRIHFMWPHLTHSFTLTLTLAHSFTRSVSQKLQHFFPSASASSCLADCVKIRLGFGYFFFLFFFLCRVLEIVHTEYRVQSCPRALSWRESYEFYQASEYFFLSLTPCYPRPPCSALNRNMVFPFNSLDSAVVC